MAATFVTIAAALTITTVMSSVISYDDGSSFCTGNENVARCRLSQYFPGTDPEGTQKTIQQLFYNRAFDARAVCYRLSLQVTGNDNNPINFDVYCYLTCRVKECKFCYQKAFKWLMEKDGSGCPGNAGAFISLDGDNGCCLRYEMNTNFCGVSSDATKQNQNG